MRHEPGRLRPAASGRAEPDGDRGQSALTQLRAWLAQKELPPSTRLPPERELSELLGVSRGDLRKALAILERQGELWRHVGKGTFIGARPVAELSSVAAIAAADQSRPRSCARGSRSSRSWRARRRCTRPPTTSRRCSSASRGARGAETWRQYESWDNRLHRAIAEAAHNALLLAVFDTRERGAPRRRLGPAPRRGPHPPADHHSFAEHEAIVAAIEERDLARSGGRACACISRRCRRCFSSARRRAGALAPRS